MIQLSIKSRAIKFVFSLRKALTNLAPAEFIGLFAINACCFQKLILSLVNISI